MLFDLIFTDERVIVVQTSHPSEKYTIESSLFMKSLFMGNWLHRSPHYKDRAALPRYEVFKGESPDGVLEKNPHRLMMRYEDIATVEISRQWFQTRIRFHLSQPAGGTVRSFNLPSAKVTYARQLLEQVLKSRIK